MAVCVLHSIVFVFLLDLELNESNSLTRLVVNRDKPMSQVMDVVWKRVTNLTTDQSLPLRLPKVSLTMFGLNMVDNPKFFLFQSTRNILEHLLTLRGTQGWYLNHVLPIRPSKSYSQGWVGLWPMRFKWQPRCQRPNSPFLFGFDIEGSWGWPPLVQEANT